tara:strand:- start:265 stop:792 length:528 start_codon:yes stop_codon:yes gene_type:complete
MIVTCPNCKKKFTIDPSLIPVEGRDLQCGSCDKVWFYKVDDQSENPLTLNKDFINNETKPNFLKKERDEIIKNKDKDEIIENKVSLKTDKTEKKDEKFEKISEKEKTLATKKKKENISSKFFSYLVVFTISFAALIVLVDTLKTPLINIFPGLEMVLFNLFETLQDIKLFIIDLY